RPRASVSRHGARRSRPRNRNGPTGTPGGPIWPSNRAQPVFPQVTALGTRNKRKGMESNPTAVEPGQGASAEGRATPGIDEIRVLEARETSGMTSKLVLAYAERIGGRGAVDAGLRR